MGRLHTDPCHHLYTHKLAPALAAAAAATLTATLTAAATTAAAAAAGVSLEVFAAGGRGVCSYAQAPPLPTQSAVVVAASGERQILSLMLVFCRLIWLIIRRKLIINCRLIAKLADARLLSANLANNLACGEFAGSSQVER